MANTDLAIQIATTLDATGLNKANKSVSKLEKNAKKLGKSLGLALSTAAIVAFGKAAVKAFADDEKAAKQLANTLNNLGLGFATAQNEKFIQSLEASSNILDDVLRPSLQKLITTTGSLTYAQDLLTKATSIARGSGLDLTTVANDLALAYVGNTRGLMKYGLGLSKAELAAMSFEQIMAALNKQFAGANAAYLDTYAGKMDALNVASANAKETIGKGLLDAFTILAGGADSSITQVTDAIDKLATGIANVLTGTAYYVKKLLDNPIVQALLKAAYWLATHTGALSGVKRAMDKGESLGTKETVPKITPSQKALLELQLQQAQANAKLLKAQKAATAEQKKQLALKKAGTIFDLEQIQLIAALKGQVSDQDRKRLELQFALLQGNEEEASRLTYQLAKAQGLGEQIARDLASLPAAKNPFASWEAYLDMIAAKAKQIANMTVNAPTGTAAAAAAAGTAVSAVASNVSTNVPVTGFTPPPSGTYGTPTGPVQGPQVIELKITGDGDLTNTIAKNLMQQSLSTGNQTYVNRRTGGFE